MRNYNIPVAIYSNAQSDNSQLSGSYTELCRFTQSRALDSFMINLLYKRNDKRGVPITYCKIYQFFVCIHKRVMKGL